MVATRDAASRDCSGDSCIARTCPYGLPEVGGSDCSFVVMHEQYFIIGSNDDA